MPNIGKKSGAAKAAGRNKQGSKSKPMQINFGRGGKPRKGRGAVDEDDAVLNPGVDYAEDMAETGENEVTVEPVEPFSDGLVSARLRGLVVIPRMGGEDVAALHDFLELFAKTEPFIGAISSKTSFMKKTGGRLL